MHWTFAFWMCLESSIFLKALTIEPIRDNSALGYRERQTTTENRERLQTINILQSYRQPTAAPDEYRM